MENKTAEERIAELEQMIKKLRDAVMFLHHGVGTPPDFPATEE